MDLSWFTSVSVLFLGCPDHAGSAADPRTDCHAAPGAEAEHSHPQRADPEDRRGAMKLLPPTPTHTHEHSSRLDDVPVFHMAHLSMTGCSF